jgi:hypothetical protein
MKNFDIEVFVKDLDKLFNDMQDKAIAGSENVATASWVIKQQQAEIEALKADSARYQWLRAEFAAGRETYLAEGIPNGEELDKYIDRKANK